MTTTKDHQNTFGWNFFNPLGFLDNDRDTNLVKMILNLEANSTDDYKKPADLYDAYINAKELNYNQNITHSLKTSKNMLTSQWDIKRELEALLPCNGDSFLILPLCGKGHLWSTLIRNDEEGYHAYVINKGMRYWHDPAEEFVFSYKNVENLIKTLRYADTNSNENIENVYRKFINNSDAKYNLNLHLGPQKVGNCFVKNIQAAIKLATASSKKKPLQMISLRINKPYTPFGTGNERKITFKWNDMTTENMQKLVAKKIIKKNPSIRNDIEKSILVYSANKEFRQSLKEGKSSVDSIIKAFNPLNKVSFQSTNQKIKTAMENLTPHNFTNFKKSITEIVKATQDTGYIQMFDKLDSISQVAHNLANNERYNYYMEASHDPTKSLIKVFGRYANLNNMDENQKLKLLLNNLTQTSLSRHEKPVKSILKNLYGLGNICKEYKSLLDISQIKSRDFSNELPSIRKNLNELQKYFPLIVVDIKENLRDGFLFEAKYQLFDKKAPKSALEILDNSMKFGLNNKNLILKGLCHTELKEYSEANIAMDLMSKNNLTNSKAETKMGNIYPNIYTKYPVNINPKINAQTRSMEM